MSNEDDDIMSELRDILFALNKKGGQGELYCKRLDLFLDKAEAYELLQLYEADAKASAKKMR